MTATDTALPSDAQVDETRQAFDRDGFAVVRGLFDAQEMRTIAAESDRLLGLENLIDFRNLRTLPKQTTDGQPIVERFDPVQDVSPVFRGVCEHPRLLAHVRAVLDDEPMLFKDKLIFKLAGTQGYTLHQDCHQWEPFPVEDIVSAMVAIDAAEASNGALELFPGYHKWLQVSMFALGGHGRMLAERIDLDRAVMVQTQPGDVILFHSRTPHRSGPNTSDRSRRQYYPTFSAARHGNLYHAHYDHVHQLRRREMPDKRLYMR